jgi:hypothetical protein
MEFCLAFSTRIIEPAEFTGWDGCSLFTSLSEISIITVMTSNADAVKINMLFR